MKLSNHGVLAGTLTTFLAAAFFAPVFGAAATWTEGVNYYLVEPVRPTSLPAGKVEVTEIFSYACPACNLFQPTMRKLKQSLPANAVPRFRAGILQSQRGLAHVPAGVLHGPGPRYRGPRP